VHELALVQQQLLDHVVGSVKPGGRLIYSVCTLTRAETRDAVDAFTRKHPEFRPVAVFPETAGQKAEVSSQAPAVEDALPQKPDLNSLTSDLSRPTSVLLWPHELNSNGMFIAAWRRQA
jgi:16S rRNA (cytosine967-C5)-methyltransferase